MVTGESRVGGGKDVRSEKSGTVVVCSEEEKVVVTRYKKGAEWRVGWGDVSKKCAEKKGETNKA